MEEKKEAWYVHAIVTLVCIGLTYFAFTDYEQFVRPDSPGSSRSNRLFLLIFNFFDALGGKWMVLVIMALITMFFLVQTIKRFKERKID